MKIFGTIGCLAALAGCADRDPYYRNDVWQPTGANAANIAAMVANPNDLLIGRGGAPDNAQAPATAVQRLWVGMPRSVTPGTTPPNPNGGAGSGGSTPGSGSGSGSGTGAGDNGIGAAAAGLVGSQSGS